MVEKLKAERDQISVLLKKVPGILTCAVSSLFAGLLDLCGVGSGGIGTLGFACYA